MSIPGSSSPLFFQTAAGGAGTFEGPAYSARFDADNYNFLYRTPSSAGNRRKWTWAGWIKRSKLGAEDGVFSSYGDAHPNTAFVFNQDNTFQFHDFANSSFNFKLVSNRVLRDVGSWYHIIVAVDTTQSIAAYRIRIYINGTLLSSSDYSTAQWPSENFETDLNSATRTDIGYHAGTYFSGYMADIHFIDGQQLDHTDLGGFDSNGVWQAKDFTGTYGTNGYRINFSNVTSSASFGEDSSGNDNDHGVQGFRYVAGPFASYAPYLTASSGGFDTSHPAQLAFNGDQGTHAKAATAGASLTFQPSSSISYSSSVQTRTPTADSNVSINGGSASFAEGGNTWTTIASGSGTISSIVFNTTGGSDFMSLAGIKIDGEYLLDLTAGGRTDLYRDSPVNGTQSDTGAGGEVTGNYATFNSLDCDNGTVSSGGLVTTKVNNSDRFGPQNTTIGVSSGKWYAEFTWDSGVYGLVGITHAQSAGRKSTTWHRDADTYTWYFSGAFMSVAWPGTSTFPDGSNPTFTVGDIVGVLLDKDNDKLYFTKNGSYIASMNAATGTNGIDISAHSGKTAFMTCGNNNNTQSTFTLNAGQRAFANAAPTDYKPLGSTTLPTPTIADGSAHFDVKLWTGNASTDRDITGLGFSPDLTWIKIRNGVYGHFWFDTIRGATKDINSEANYAESTVATSLQSFESDGFNLGNSVYVNQNGETYVAWNWDAGSSTASNTDGSVTSQVRVNQTAGFSIVSWTSSSSSGNLDSIGHGLNALPGLVITKRRTVADSWYSAHGFDLTKFGTLDTTNAFASAGTAWGNGHTSSVIGMRVGNFCNPSETLIAYCFAPVAGYSAFGSYEGNGSTDGPFIYTGFKPALLMFKRTDGAAGWYIYDYKRDGYNAANKLLYANYGNAEADNSIPDLLSNGFKIRTTGTVANGNGNDYIYMAWAENPFSSNGGLAR